MLENSISRLPPSPLGFWRVWYSLRVFAWSFVERLGEKNAKMHVEFCAVLLTLRSMNVELAISTFGAVDHV
jgi:hypothetical protein